MRSGQHMQTRRCSPGVRELPATIYLDQHDASYADLRLEGLQVKQRLDVLRRYLRGPPARRALVTRRAGSNLRRRHG
jgi:hypothetical protein